jgi:hypothetical protein
MDYFKLRSVVSAWDGERRVHRVWVVIGMQSAYVGTGWIFRPPGSGQDNGVTWMCFCQQEVWSDPRPQLGEGCNGVSYLAR